MEEGAGARNGVIIIFDRSSCMSSVLQSAVKKRAGEMKPSSESNLSISSSDADAEADDRLEVLRERGVLFADCPRIKDEDDM